MRVKDLFVNNTIIMLKNVIRSTNLTTFMSISDMISPRHGKTDQKEFGAKTKKS